MLLNVISKKVKILLGIAVVLSLTHMNPAKAASPKLDDLNKAIEFSTAYMQKHTRNNGMFVYTIHLDPQALIYDEYNILRHGGSIYSMTMAYENQPSPALKESILRAATYLKEEALWSVPFQKPMLAVWSRPEVNKAEIEFQAKLGGTGLGLVALLSIEKFEPGFTPLADLQKMGQFIVFMQKRHGGFYTKYIPAEGGLWDEWESLYYPGEAALGLLLLHEKDPKGPWRKTALDALAYLAGQRKGHSDVPADHWALLATAKLMRESKSSLTPEEIEMLQHHAAQICDTILRSQVLDKQSPKTYGGYDIDGRTTPTATRLEGLLASISDILPSDHPMHAKVKKSVPLATQYLLQSQVTTEPFVGAIPRATITVDPFRPGGHPFNLRKDEVRIDYVQHALSAFIQYRDYYHPKK